MSARVLLATLIFVLVLVGPATSGKNSGGALVVHTDDDLFWTNGVCSFFDSWVPQICSDLNTRTDHPYDRPALIYLIAAFPDTSSPAVTSTWFGNDHNLPTYYHNRLGPCGPAGTGEVADPGWPEDPAQAGNHVIYPFPLTDDPFFPIYYISVWGFDGAYYGTGIHPTLGYAAFEDDAAPPEINLIWRFGKVRWYASGENTCPGEGSGEPDLVTCCLMTGVCTITSLLECDVNNGTDLGGVYPCEPNPCVQPAPGACCRQSGQCDFVLEFSCDYTGGIFLGEGVGCDPNPCFGACCYYSGDCLMQALYWCGQMGGGFMGAGTDCDPNPCVNSSAPEMLIHENTWGAIKARYR